jgi:hypothetical protein
MQCIGCWSGSIGWLDVDVTKRNDSDVQYQLKPRSDSNTRNMRLSFQTRDDDATIADWVVYHARGQGVREEVTLTKSKKNNGDLPIQTFYAFQDGNLGRCGSNFMELPVVEHGFWDVSPEGSGERRTVVLVYNPQSGHLMKICYLKQKKKIGRAVENFDVSAVERRDIGVMPKKAKMSLQQLKRNWLHSPKPKCVEVLNVSRHKYKSIDSGVNEEVDNTLMSLLGSKESDNCHMLRVSLPNGVALACPISIKSDDGGILKSFDISMGCENSNRDVQVIEFKFEQCKLKSVKGSVIKV